MSKMEDSEEPREPGTGPVGAGRFEKSLRVKVGVGAAAACVAVLAVVGLLLLVAVDESGEGAADAVVIDFGAPPARKALHGTAGIRNEVRRGATKHRIAMCRQSVRTAHALTKLPPPRRRASQAGRGWR